MSGELKLYCPEFLNTHTTQHTPTHTHTQHTHENMHRFFIEVPDEHRDFVTQKLSKNIIVCSATCNSNFTCFEKNKIFFNRSQTVRHGKNFHG